MVGYVRCWVSSGTGAFRGAKGATGLLWLVPGFEQGKGVAFRRYDHARTCGGSRPEPRKGEAHQPRTLPWGLRAPEGRHRHRSAQGVALGAQGPALGRGPRHPGRSPERATQWAAGGTRGRPFSYPRVLPWADLLRPFGALNSHGVALGWLVVPLRGSQPPRRCPGLMCFALSGLPRETMSPARKQSARI